MLDNDKNKTLFLSALKEVARQYPRYFSYHEGLDQIESMWDLQPNYAALEHLLLEDEAMQQFIFSVWSFFSPLSFKTNSLAETIRPLEPWQREILVELIINDSF